MTRDFWYDFFAEALTHIARRLGVLVSTVNNEVLEYVPAAPFRVFDVVGRIGWGGGRAALAAAAAAQAAAFHWGMPLFGQVKHDDDVRVTSEIRHRGGPALKILRRHGVRVRDDAEAYVATITDYCTDVRARLAVGPRRGAAVFAHAALTVLLRKTLKAWRIPATEHEIVPGCWPPRPGPAAEALVRLAKTVGDDVLEPYRRAVERSVEAGLDNVIRYLEAERREPLVEAAAVAGFLAGHAEPVEFSTGQLVFLGRGFKTRSGTTCTWPRLCAIAIEFCRENVYVWSPVRRYRLKPPVSRIITTIARAARETMKLCPFT